MTPQDVGFGESRNTHSAHVGLRGWWHRLVHVAGEYASTLKLVVFRHHLAIYLLILTAGDLLGQTFLFFIIYDWNKIAAFASLLLSAGIISTPLTPLFGAAMTKIGPKRLNVVGFTGCLVRLAWISLAWRMLETLPEPWWTAFAVTGALWFFCFKGMIGYLPWAVFPFIADVDQVVTRRYRGSTFSGLQGFFRQITSGLAFLIVGGCWAPSVSIRHCMSKRPWYKTVRPHSYSAGTPFRLWSAG
ncbi:MFS transporter [Bifidobacterium bohemicum]|uniref:Putative MFS transporter n=1 Tax=Bifidobacterium bohemicum DSM 22767 TaxID=1437606 RepID=A0A086ZDV9_9BIFI|nr:MFS transporter [Bifidobacterium bohemicum]KFI44709.1 putative MFS transporter [Bifidobacterium bohemicum DSM 22767]